MTPQIAARPHPAAIRILIIDDHTLFAQTLSAALERKGMEMIGIATSRAEAIEMTGRGWPDVILIDIGLRTGDGMSVAKSLTGDAPPRRVIGLTSGEHEVTQREAVEAGLRGLLLKSTSLEGLLTSIGSVHDGIQAFQTSTTGATQASWSGGHAHALAGLLTSREQEILGLLAEALATPRIAEHLNLSISTVRTHVQTILGKLEVHSRLEAVAFARLHGIIDSGLTVRFPQNSSA